MITHPTLKCRYLKFVGKFAGRDCYEAEVSPAPRVKVLRGEYAGCEAWIVAVGEFGATLLFDNGKTSRFYNASDLQVVQPIEIKYPMRVERMAVVQ